MTTERINTYWQFHPYKFLVHVTDLTLPCKTSKPFFDVINPSKKHLINSVTYPSVLLGRGGGSVCP